MRKKPDVPPLTNNAMAHMLRSTASALDHGRRNTACVKVAAVHAELFAQPNVITRGLAAEMKRRFPWLGTEEDAGSGADVIMYLADWYSELTKGVQS